MSKTKKITLASVCAIAIAAVFTAMLAIPAYATNEQIAYEYALQEENWVLPEEEYQNAQIEELSSVRAIIVEVKGYTFDRIDQETLKQYNCQTSLTIEIQQPTETTSRSIEVKGTVEINGVTYTIQSGTASLKEEKKLVSLNCKGIDENGNEITLKLRARYFWWGGNSYALRSIAVLQTTDNTMLLLQRGIAKIQ